MFDLISHKIILFLWCGINFKRKTSLTHVVALASHLNPCMPYSLKYDYYISSIKPQ